MCIHCEILTLSVWEKKFRWWSKSASCGRNDLVATVLAHSNKKAVQSSSVSLRHLTCQVAAASSLELQEPLHALPETKGSGEEPVWLAWSVQSAGQVTWHTASTRAKRRATKAPLAAL